jgi:hypothetical protein
MDYFFLHHNPTVLVHKDKPTCMRALIDLERAEIARLCKFAIQPFKADSTVLHLGQGKLVLQRVHEYSTERAGKITIHLGCDLCILQLVCDTIFRFDHFIFFAPLSDCLPGNSTTHNVEYAINLILFDKLFDTSELLADHRQLLTEVPNVLMPNFSIALDSSYKQLGILSQPLIDFDVALNNSLIDKQSFLAISDKILYDLQHLDFSILSVKEIIGDILTYLNPVISVVALLLALHLYLKQRTLFAALAIFGVGRNVEAVEHTYKRIWFPDQWKKKAVVSHVKSPLEMAPTSNTRVTVPEFDVLDVSENSFQSTVIVILCIFLALIVNRFAVKLVYYCLPYLARCKRCLTKSQPTDCCNDRDFFFTVILVLGGGKKQLFLDLIQIPYSPQHYEFKATRFIRDVKITGICSPKLQFSWPDFQILNKYAPLVYSLPEQLSLTKGQANSARKILAESHHILLFTKTPTGPFDLVPLKDYIWEANDGNMLTPTVPLRTAQRSALYPSLLDNARM